MHSFSSASIDNDEQHISKFHIPHKLDWMTHTTFSDNRHTTHLSKSWANCLSKCFVKSSGENYRRLCPINFSFFRASRRHETVSRIDNQSSDHHFPKSNIHMQYCRYLQRILRPDSYSLEGAIRLKCGLVCFVTIMIRDDSGWCERQATTVSLRGSSLQLNVRDKSSQILEYQKPVVDHHRWCWKCNTKRNDNIY